MKQFTTLLHLSAPTASTSPPSAPVLAASAASAQLLPPVLAASAASLPPIPLYADPFTFQPTPTDSEAGLSWLCDHTFVIDTPSDSVLRTFSRPRHAILTLHATDGTTYDIGTITMPATVFITRHLQRSQLVVTCTMLTDPLS